MVGEQIAGLTVHPIDDLEQRRAPAGVAIGVIATPAGAAQDVCDRLVAAGVSSILNFAPTVLTVPDGVDVRKVDLSIELQILAFHEQRKAAAERDRSHPLGIGRAPMSLLVVGLSHRTAPVALLERVALDADAARRARSRRPGRRARRRGDRARDLQPGRGLRRRRDRSTAVWPTSAALLCGHDRRRRSTS